MKNPQIKYRNNLGVLTIFKPNKKQIRRMDRKIKHVISKWNRNVFIPKNMKAEYYP